VSEILVVQVVKKRKKKELHTHKIATTPSFSSVISQPSREISRRRARYAVFDPHQPK
jgi:hypothetical protein